MQKFKVKLLNGTIVEGKRLSDVIKITGDRIFIPIHLKPSDFNFKQYSERIKKRPPRLIYDSWGFKK